jgi:DNA-binding HxlR family transcriptional regulator
MKKRSRRLTPPDDYPIRELLDGIGNKWSYLILLSLAERPMRFGEFRVEIDDISQRALTETLRSLQRDGFVARAPFSTRPPSIRYRLTELGESLVGPVKCLERWATDNMTAIMRHRDTFDETKGQPPAPL